MIVRTILKEKTSNDVATIFPDQTIGELAKTLFQNKCGALLVVDEARNILGIISERDVVRGMAQQGAAITEVKVRELMTSTVLFCSPDDPLEKLMGIMTTRRVRHLPVMENGKLVGMVTIGDMVKARLDEAAMQVDALREYVMAAR